MYGRGFFVDDVLMAQLQGRWRYFRFLRLPHQALFQLPHIWKTTILNIHSSISPSHFHPRLPNLVSCLLPHILKFLSHHHMR